MAEKKLKIDQILVKRGNSSQWSSTSYILKDGELGWDTEAKILKIGNGTDSWGDLTVVGADTEAIRLINEIVGLLQTDLDNAEIAIAANTDSIEAINTKIGTVPEGKDVVTMISDAQTAATYDDTELSGRVKTIEDDYLKTSDKTTLENSIKTNADAIDVLNGDETKEGSVKKTVVDEIAKVVADAPEDFDTLKEIADWIANDQTGAASLTNRIAEIENTYLTEDEINDLIAEVELYIGTIPEGATSTNVVAYIQEVVDALKIGDYAKASDLANLTTRVETIETTIGTIIPIELSPDMKFETIGEILNYNTTMNNNQGSMLNTLDQVASSAATNINQHKNDTTVHITAEERTKWDSAAAVANAANTNAHSALEQFDNLSEALNTHTSNQAIHVTAEQTLSWNFHRDNDTIHVTEEDKALWNGLPAALAKKIAGVKVAGTALTADTDGNVNIPVATADTYGVVKSSTAEGKVSVDADGIMTVNSLNVNNLVQTDGDILILDCGTIE